MNTLQILEAGPFTSCGKPPSLNARSCCTRSAKDSSVTVHLAREAFFPGPIPFRLMHIDTGYEYPEIISFRDWFVAEIGARLIVHTNRSTTDRGVNPHDIGTARFCLAATRRKSR
jgi:3'-phosphoadenosine 5'-phosphosulfate sulfotransferase (PAPS reductase)/FAD synthetase